MKKQALLMLLAIFSFVSTYATQKVENYNTKQPSVFYQNKGQIIDQDRKVRKDVRYHYAAPGFALSITDKGMSWTVTKTERFEKKVPTPSSAMAEATPPKAGNLDSLVFHTHRVDVEFVGANMMIPIEEAQVQSYYQNFYTEYTGEQGVTNLHGAKQITLKNVWNGIDIVFQAKEEAKLEYDFILHPNANIKDIQLKYNGQNAMNLLGGYLVFQTSIGEVRETIPMSYEKENSKSITVGYQLNNNVVSFATKAEYNKQNTLVIDPQLLWGTYFGAAQAQYEYGNGIAIDSSGNVYITGFTGSTSGIASSGTHQTSYAGNTDIFITKFSASNGTQTWGTYYGGNSDDYGTSIALDTSGNLYVTGYTQSTSGIATSGTHQASFAGDYDAFITKFSASNGTQTWGTYYGGVNEDGSSLVSIDGSGNVYVTGYTQSTSGIATSGTHQTSHAGDHDAFITKFSASNGTQTWGTYYGGSDSEAGKGIAVDDSGNVYVTGYTQSTSGIATSGTHQTSTAGSYDAFIAKFSASNGTQTWGSYYGGNSNEGGYGIAVDESGNVYITGDTRSTSGIATSGTHQTSYAGGYYDAFIAKFSASNGTQTWGSYYGGNSNEGGYGIAVDESDNVYIIGYTNSTSGIATSGTHQTSFAGDVDAFIAKFSVSNGTQTWGTYYGGDYNEEGNSIVVDGSDNAYITGYTGSTSGIATSGTHQTSYAGNTDIFIAKFGTPCTPPIANAGRDTTVCGKAINYQIGANAQKRRYYKWTSNSAGYTNKTANPKVSPTLTTSYYLQDSVSGGCVGYDTVTITINPLPSIQLGKDTSVLSGTQLSLGISPQNGYKYLWNTRDTVSQISPVIVKDSVFVLELTSDKGCKNSDSIKVSILTGLDEQLTIQSIQLYPNPADNSVLTIQGVNQSASLRITDMNGKTLYQQPLQASDKQTVNTNLPQGMYLVEIQLPNQVVMKKWMVR